MFRQKLFILSWNIKKDSKNETALPPKTQNNYKRGLDPYQAVFTFHLLKTTYLIQFIFNIKDKECLYFLFKRRNTGMKKKCSGIY